MKKLSLAATTLLISSPAMAMNDMAPCPIMLYQSFLAFFGLA